MAASSLTEDYFPIIDITLELNSHVSIPCHLQKCLDLKTGEIYYINCNNGMIVKQDPRKLVSSNNNTDESSEESSNGTVFSEEDSEESSSESSIENHKDEDVLVVGGCKVCFMYFMVPKLLEDCPKCSAQLLHFDRPHSPSS